MELKVYLAQIISNILPKMPYKRERNFLAQLAEEEGFEEVEENESVDNIYDNEFN